MLNMISVFFKWLLVVKAVQLFLSLLISLCFIASASGKEEAVNCEIPGDKEFTATQINILSKPIFDEEAEDAIALHHWANSIHSITKPWVILERLSFDEGDPISQQDIAEAEAILRAQRYLANAKIQSRVDCATETVELDITTWDNWSLIPTLSLGRSGGQNNSIIGIREDNLFGMGIRATARYSEDEQRSGYQVTFSSLVPWIRHANVFFALADNDDGEVHRIILDKPFYHLNTQNSFLFSAENRTRVEDIFQNDDTRNSLLIDSHEVSAAYGWLLDSDNLRSNRIMLGVTHEKADFTIANESPSSDVNLVPQNRDFLYPWLQYEFIERNIVVMEDVYLINQPEDINLAWQVRSRVGIELSNKQDGLGIHSQVSAQKGFKFGMNLLMLKSDFQAITDADINDFMRIDTGVEYFHRTDSELGYFARINSTFSRGQLLDDPIVMDDENGVRGFPNQYQHGDRRLSASAEIRWYADYNVYQLFEMGFAGYVDVGRAWGGEEALLNADDGTLASVGIGVRLYSNKASQPGVVHIDISRPIGDDEELDGVEISAQLRRSF